MYPREKALQLLLTQSQRREPQSCMRWLILVHPDGQKVRPHSELQSLPVTSTIVPSFPFAIPETSQLPSPCKKQSETFWLL